MAPRDSECRIFVKGALPDPVVEIEHPEERLIIFVAMDKIGPGWILAQRQAAFAQCQGLFTGHTLRQQAVAIGLQVHNRRSQILVHYSSTPNSSVSADNCLQTPSSTTMPSFSLRRKAAYSRCPGINTPSPPADGSAEAT